MVLPDGGLAPRSRQDAVLAPAAAAEQARRLAQTGEFDTLCIHGDGPAARDVAAAVRQALRESGIGTRPLAAPPSAGSGR